MCLFIVLTDFKTGMHVHNVHVHIKYNICMMIVELIQFTELTQIIVRFYFNIQSHTRPIYSTRHLLCIKTPLKHMQF